MGKTVDAGRLQLELTELLGEGAYGVVFRARSLVPEAPSASSSSSSAYTPAPREYAVKVLRKAADWTPEGQSQHREVMLHQLVSGSHPSILPLHAVVEDEAHIYLVLDFCSGGDLYNAIVERHAYARNDELVKHVFVQILDAVQACHDHGVFHRDLKPDNIFVSADSARAYLGDFGLATDEALSRNHACGSSYYMSPECIGEERNFGSFYNETSDIWALGVVLCNMLTGRNPWRRATTEDAHFAAFLHDGAAVLTSFLPISVQCAELLARVFTFNPAERITLAELRAGVLGMKTFFMSAGEVACAGPEARCAAAAYTPRLPEYTTPELVGDERAFHDIHHFPDDEYLFGSPDPDADWSAGMSSEPLSSSSTLFSLGSTLCEESVSEEKGKGKEIVVEEAQDYFVGGFGEKLTMKNGKLSALQDRPAERFLAKMLA